MNRDTYDRLLGLIEVLVSPRKPSEGDQTERGGRASQYGYQTEGLISEILQPLLKEDGYEESHLDEMLEVNLELIAERRATPTTKHHTIAAAYKARQGGRVDATDIYDVLGAVTMYGVDRAILITDGTFSQQARALVARHSPTKLELIDPDGLRGWLSRVSVSQEVEGRNFDLMISAVSDLVARNIAEDPGYLHQIEWFDLERVIAEVFKGFGFNTVHTPFTKDGGKDVTLKFTLEGQDRRYYVEIKHWKSGKRVSEVDLREFITVVVKDKQDGGLFLSSSGYVQGAREALSVIEREQVKTGDGATIRSLCTRYTRLKSGLWSPPSLTEVLFEKTA